MAATKSNLRKAAERSIDRAARERTACELNILGNRITFQDPTSPPFLNGNEDAFASVLGLYTRAVAEAGAADLAFESLDYPLAREAADLASDMFGTMNAQAGQSVESLGLATARIDTFARAGNGTIAYEDVPDGGEMDYTSLVLRLHETAVYDDTDHLVRIVAFLETVARGTTFDGQLLLKIPELKGPWTFSFTVYTAGGFPIASRQVPGADALAITLLDSTEISLVGHVPNTVRGQQPTAPPFLLFTVAVGNPAGNPRETLSRPPYNIALTVPELNVSYNLGDTFVNNLGGRTRGYTVPRAVVAGIQWKWPLIKTFIEDAYPLFADFISGQNAEDWFLSWTEGRVY